MTNSEFPDGLPSFPEVATAPSVPVIRDGDPSLSENPELADGFTELASPTTADSTFTCSAEVRDGCGQFETARELATPKTAQLCPAGSPLLLPLIYRRVQEFPVGR